MKYYIETNIDCEACLYIVLSNLLEFSKNGLFFKSTDSGYLIIANTSLEIKTLTKIIKNKLPVPAKITKEKALNQTEYQNLILGFTPYTKSFW